MFAAFYCSGSARSARLSPVCSNGFSLTVCLKLFGFCLHISDWSG